ncbi:hypothetical protein [Spirosoma endophyticum]|uniref:Uncharacterized protein n=1 Tax=Spirosoma endophyticum TaxID=662367 RepID=A0A1I1UNZ6_9BACT|nr:hypothetical protein [Spirosoma endophyticum]SFD72295.1 hypothetical protein SAMN05216167_106336 [Spirosoma endophyticum]
MGTDELHNILIDSIDELYRKDSDLITKNLHERTISHKLAVYLGDRIYPLCLNLDVDFEYNGDVENTANNYKKSLKFLSDKLTKINQKVKNDKEFQTLSVYPDIIVHKRRENENNLLLIEIKKKYKGRLVNDEFDRLKLRHYTSDSHENHLKYKLGAYIEFDTLISGKSYRIDYYQDGELIRKVHSP